MNMKFTRILWMMLTLTMCASLTSCRSEIGNEDKPTVPEVITLMEDAQEQGAVVSFSYTIDGVEHVATFIREGNKYVLQNPAATRADGDDLVPFINAVGGVVNDSDRYPDGDEDDDDEEVEWDDDDEHWIDGYTPQDEDVEEGDDIEEDWDPEDDDEEGDGSGSGSSVRAMDWGSSQGLNQSVTWPSTPASKPVVTRALLNDDNRYGTVIAGVYQMSTGKDRLQVQINSGTYREVTGTDQFGHTVTFTGLMTVNGKKADLKKDENPEQGDFKVRKITLRKKKRKIHEKKVVKFQANVTPANVPDDCIKWETSNAKQVLINNFTRKKNIFSCHVTGISAGDPIITVGEEGGQTATYQVTVWAVKGIKILQKHITLQLGEDISEVKVTLNADVNPSDATVKDVYWSSSNPTVASVDVINEGNFEGEIAEVTAYAAGKVKITAITKDGQRKSTRTINIKGPKQIELKSVNFSKKEVVLNVGEAFNISCTYNPAVADKQEGFDYKWWSDNEDVATVNGDATSGTIQAVTPGKCNVYISTNSGKTAKCKVTVNGVNVTGVTIAPTSLTLARYETAQLTATILPEDATVKDVTWTSSDESVVTVDENGLVKAGDNISEGTITVTTKDGKKTAICKVFVKFTGSISYATTVVNKTNTDVAFIHPLTIIGDGTVTYTSSDTNVAEVNESTGEVIIKGTGSVTITATVADSGGYTYKTKTASYTLNVSANPSILDKPTGYGNGDNPF